MEMSRIEYLRKNGRKRGHKKGVLFCGIDLDNDQSVVLGFTLCHSIDRFDYINDQRVPGFGLETAKLRAEKWKFHTDYFIQNSHTEKELDSGVITYIINPDNGSVVEIPPSIIDRLKTFIERCRKYYKDKEFPNWVKQFEVCESYPKEKMMECAVVTKDSEEIEDWSEIYK